MWEGFTVHTYTRVLFPVQPFQQFSRHPPDASSLPVYHRAFLKAPRILLFDEATSALDSHTEGGVMEALHELAQVWDIQSRLRKSCE